MSYMLFAVIYFVAHMFRSSPCEHLQAGSSVKFALFCFYVCFDMPASLSTSLLSGPRCSRIILLFPSPRPGLSYFYKEFWFLLVENTIQKPRSVILVWSLPLGCCFSQAMQVDRATTHMRAHTYIHTLPFTLILNSVSFQIENHMISLIPLIPVDRFLC